LGRNARPAQPDSVLLDARQTVLTGGHNAGDDFWVNTQSTLNLETQKFDWRSGRFFKFAANTAFDSDAFRDTGAIIPINAAALCPETITGYRADERNLPGIPQPQIVSLRARSIQSI
jgi:hypothetical protein